ncbi:MAG TPA: TIGR04255 family protein [Acidimicrobiales bacterium]|nr:TIGR04255 family protein [Acidimicrobiales bacterium]
MVDFAEPPVDEVALAVHFEPLVGLRAVHLGGLWAKWRDRFPLVEEHPPLPPLAPEVPHPKPSAVSIEVVQDVPHPRSWFLNAGGSELVQFQRDRLVHNWRRTAPGDPYPHYDSLRPTFERNLHDLVEFLEEEGLEPMRPVQCELTYANPIPPADLGPARRLSTLIAPWSDRYSGDLLPDADDVRFLARYSIRDPDGDWAGRLHVNVQPMHRLEPVPDLPEEVVMLQVFARGAPRGKGIEGILAFLDLGHEWVVNGFLAVTTTEMQRRWGRTDV